MITKHKQFKHWTVQSVDPQPEPVSDESRIEALEREVQELRRELQASKVFPNPLQTISPVLPMPSRDILPTIWPYYTSIGNGTQQ